MTQVFDRVLEKFALGDLAIQFVLSKEFQNLVKVLVVFLIILAIDENIININHHEFVEEWTEDFLDQSLECCRGIGETKRHDFVLIVAISGAESCFFDVLFMDSDLMIARAEIDLGKNLGIVQLVDKVFNEQDWETVLDCDLV